MVKRESRWPADIVSICDHNLSIDELEALIFQLDVLLGKKKGEKDK